MFNETLIECLQDPELVKRTVEQVTGDESTEEQVLNVLEAVCAVLEGS